MSAPWLPSEQFADEKTLPTTRRPVLRKIEQYVEILQPERRYPEKAETSPRTVAPFWGVRFDSRKILRGR